MEGQREGGREGVEWKGMAIDSGGILKLQVSN